MVGLRRRILLRLRRAIVLAVVVFLVAVLAVVFALLVAVTVTGMPVPLAVSVMLVAIAMALMLVVRLMVLRGMTRAAVVLRLRLFADSGLRGRRDTALARTLARSDPGEGSRGCRAGSGTRGRLAVGRRLARPRRRRLPRGARGGRRPGGDDRRDIAGSRGRSGDGGLVSGKIEKPGRGQHEANGGYHGEHAGCRCSYARKTTPHKCPIGAPAPVLNLNGRIRTSRPLTEHFLQHEGVGWGLGNPSIPLGMAVSGRTGAAVVIEHHVGLLSV